MCRLAAYLGPEIPLRSFLLDFPHSLYQQSWDPKELTEARLNADGYGVAWRQRDGRMGADTIIWLASAPELQAYKTPQLWFDRRPHAFDVLPSTKSKPNEIQQLKMWTEATLKQFL